MNAELWTYLRTKIMRRWNAITEADLHHLFGPIDPTWEVERLPDLSEQFVELLLRRYDVSRFEIELQLTGLFTEIEVDVARARASNASLPIPVASDESIDRSGRSAHAS